MKTPSIRIRTLNESSINSDGQFVLYWMIANRRIRYNFSLERAVELSEDLNRPLLIFEAIRCGYRWASDRIHRFILQGMKDNRAACRDLPVKYYCFVEDKKNSGSGLLETLAEKACAIVTDDFPCFFIPHMLKKVSQRIDVAFEAVDSNGLLPMRATDEVFPTAYAFRRFLQRELPGHLAQSPQANPFARKTIPLMKSLPSSIVDRWPEATDEMLEADSTILATLPIDHSVIPASFNGGMSAAENALRRFRERRLENYSVDRNVPDEEGTSELSPYLHFGHISVHDVFNRIANDEAWSIEKVESKKASGKREGWWAMSKNSESFLDEIVTWRELGYNMCSHTDNYDQYESLPDWAKKTLEEHKSDRRDPCYELEQFEYANTHDDLWNAAQVQLVKEGRLHNYMRMLWGKKILHWAASPRDALDIMIHLNNKYAVDGRNPNSYSGIFWCLGRYDRAWGPERPIFGKVRYMTSDNTARKFSVKKYLSKYARHNNEQLSLFSDN